MLGVERAGVPAPLYVALGAKACSLVRSPACHQQRSLCGAVRAPSSLPLTCLPAHALPAVVTVARNESAEVVVARSKGIVLQALIGQGVWWGGRAAALWQGRITPRLPDGSVPVGGVPPRVRAPPCPPPRGFSRCPRLRLPAPLRAPSRHLWTRLPGAIPRPNCGHQGNGVPAVRATGGGGGDEGVPARGGLPPPRLRHLRHLLHRHSAHAAAPHSSFAAGHEVRPAAVGGEGGGGGVLWQDKRHWGRFVQGCGWGSAWACMKLGCTQCPAPLRGCSGALTLHALVAGRAAPCLAPSPVVGRSSTGRRSRVAMERRQ